MRQIRIDDTAALIVAEALKEFLRRQQKKRLDPVGLAAHEAVARVVGQLEEREPVTEEPEAPAVIRRPVPQEQPRPTLAAPPVLAFKGGQLVEVPYDSLKVVRPPGAQRDDDTSEDVEDAVG